METKNIYFIFLFLFGLFWITATFSLFFLVSNNSYNSYVHTYFNGTCVNTFCQKNETMLLQAEKNISYNPILELILKVSLAGLIGSGINIYLLKKKLRNSNNNLPKDI